MVFKCLLGSLCLGKHICTKAVQKSITRERETPLRWLDYLNMGLNIYGLAHCFIIFQSSLYSWPLGRNFCNFCSQKSPLWHFILKYLPLTEENQISWHYGQPVFTLPLRKKSIACALKTESNINLGLEFSDLIDCELLSINCAPGVIFLFFFFSSNLLNSNIIYLSILS